VNPFSNDLKNQRVLYARIWWDEGSTCSVISRRMHQKYKNSWMFLLLWLCVTIHHLIVWITRPYDKGDRSIAFFPLYPQQFCLTTTIPELAEDRKVFPEITIVPAFTTSLFEKSS
jgi:hypothetical protein